ncbi:MAG: hypothetical protein H6683_08310 [Deltaproteobacteria bacterium]|nr:hypothetical protein [Deltaproteobacteria bacterium]
MTGRIATVFSLLVLAVLTMPAKVNADIESTLDQAGNTEDENERYVLLADRLGELAPSDPLYADLERLLPVIDRWANGRGKYWMPGEAELPIIGDGGYLSDFFVLKAWPDVLGGYVYPPRVDESSPLYPIWALYRGRMLIQQAIQTNSLGESEVGRALFFDEGRRLLSIAAATYPDNRVIRMYLDEPIPWPDAYPDDPAAPEWANLQREALGKLADILDFWIDERQAPDGQFGGGWGDDVEMWRWWSPLLVGFDTAKYDDAQRLLSEGVFDLPRMAGGYTDFLTDAEHSAEDSGDVITAMMHIAPEDEVWQERALRLAELMETLWTGVNNRGYRQFKSAYFTSAEVSDNPEFACDTVFDARAMQPALLYWWRTGDETLTALFSSWMDARVDATFREDQDKPVGILPTALHWPSGDSGGTSGQWWDPGCAVNSGVYAWPTAMSTMTRALLQVGRMTGDEAYLAPIESMAELRRTYLADLPENPELGSAMWAAKEMGFLSDALAKYRLLFDDPQYDDLLRRDANGYVEYAMTGGTTALVRDLTTLARAFSVNREAYTTEVRWTDRVLSFAANYADYYADEPAARPATELLYNMVTGDFGDPLYLPLNAVRWRTSPRDIAVLLTQRSPESLAAELFDFGEEGRTVVAQFLLLPPGDYVWRLMCDGADAADGRISAELPPTELEFALPGRQLCTFEIAPASLPEDEDDDGDDDDDDDSADDDAVENTDDDDDSGGCGCG